MFRLYFDEAFRSDYRRVKRRYPGVAKELAAALELLQADGRLPDVYGAHMLSNPGGNYNGAVDFHLSGGEVDVVVLYVPHKTNPSIRFVRMGTRGELFHGPLH